MNKQLAFIITLILVSAWAEQGQRPEPSEEMKAAAKECGAPGPRKMKDLDQEEREKIRSCMEGKGFKRPEGKPPRQGN